MLGATKVGDRSLVVHTLGAVFGRRSFITAAGGRSGSMAAWQPLSVLNAEVRENPKSDLWRIGEVSAVYPLTGLRSDKKKSAISLFIAEVLYRGIRDVPDADFYAWCEKSILTLDSLEGNFANYHLRWLLELCSALGFAPAEGGLLPYAGDKLSALRALSGSFGEAMLFPMNGRARNETADILLQYLSACLECRLEIKSLAVLAELF